MTALVNHTVIQLINSWGTFQIWSAKLQSSFILVISCLFLTNANLFLVYYLRRDRSHLLTITNLHILSTSYELCEEVCIQTVWVIRWEASKLLCKGIRCPSKTCLPCQVNSTSCWKDSDSTVDTPLTISFGVLPLFLLWFLSKFWIASICPHLDNDFLDIKAYVFIYLVSLLCIVSGI